MVEILLGFMAGAWLFTLLGGVYAGWRYVYLPWKVLRRDVVALKTMYDELKADIGLRKATLMSDEDLAILEARTRAKRLWPPQGA